MQVASCFVLWVLNLDDPQLRQRVRKRRLKVRRKLAKGVVAALEAVDKDQEQRLLHPELLSCIVFTVVVSEMRSAVGVEISRTLRPRSSGSHFAISTSLA